MISQIIRNLTHYSEKINSLMLKMISNKKGLLTPQNVNNYIEKVSLKAKNFNIEPYASSKSIGNKMINN